MKTSHILILTILASKLILASNIECIINAFDREKQETGERQQSMIEIEGYEKGNKGTNENGFVDKGPGLFEKVRLGFRKFVGYDDKEIKPVTYNQLLAQFYPKNLEFVSSVYKIWINRNCVPYVEKEFKSYPKSVFICSKITKERKDQVSEMIKYEKVAHSILSNIFVRAAQEANEESPIENKGNNVLRILRDLEKAEKDIDTYFVTLWEDFSKKFDSEYDRLFQTNGEETEFMNTIKTAITEINLDDKVNEQRVTAIMLMFKDNGITLNAANALIAKNMIYDLRFAFMENPLTQVYTRLSEAFAVKFGVMEKKTVLERNILTPFCLQKLIDENKLSGGKFIEICDLVVSDYKKKALGNPSLIMLNSMVLQTSEGVREILDVIYMNIVKVRQSNTGNYSLLHTNIMTEWYAYLFKRNIYVETFSINYKPLIQDQTHGIQLLLDLEDIISLGVVYYPSIFKPEFLVGANEAVRGSVWDSDRVYTYMETERTRIIKELGENGKKIKLNKFKTLLSNSCSFNSEQQLVKLCLTVIEKPNFEKFLHYRYSNTIFRLLTGRFYDKMKTVNFMKSKESQVIGLFAETMTHHLAEFEQELQFLKNTNAQFVEDHGEMRSMMYILTAKLAYNNNIDLLPDKVYGYIIEWATQNFSKLRVLVLRNKDFNLMMEDLKSFIVFRVLEDKSEQMRLSQIEINDVDTNVKQYGLRAVEKQEIRKNMKMVLLHYKMFSDSLKRFLSECILQPETISQMITKCNMKAGKPCSQMNTFIVGKPCPDNYEFDNNQNCFATCPENFVVEDWTKCKKPVIEVIKIGKDSKTDRLKCRSGFQQDGVLCIPRCPTGWKDLGSSCERPHMKFKDEHVHVLAY